MLTHAQIQQFKIDGYLVLPQVLDANHLTILNRTVDNHLAKRVAPFELEAKLQYPGAPITQNAPGGQTIRRLLQAYERDAAFQTLAHHPDTTQAIQQILQSEKLLLNTNHHNCIMTKQAKYSSATYWHRDTRYWQFTNKYLINAWFALKEEKSDNGAMMILPGSHRWDINACALDNDQFLRTDHQDNISRLDTQRGLSLSAGDAILFSAHCFHAAGKNHTEKSKFSAVFTYHSEKTKAILGTPSDTTPPIEI